MVPNPDWSGGNTPVDMIERVTRVEGRATRLEDDVRQLAAQSKVTADALLSLNGEWKQARPGLDDMGRSIKTIETALAKEGGAREAGKAVTSWVRPVAVILVAGILTWGAASVWGNQARNDAAARAAAQEVIETLRGQIRYVPPAQPTQSMP